MDTVLAAPTDVGELGVFHLKRLWSRFTAGMEGHLDSLVIHAVGLGLMEIRDTWVLSRVAACPI